MMLNAKQQFKKWCRQQVEFSDELGYQPCAVDYYNQGYQPFMMQEMLVDFHEELKRQVVYTSIESD